MKIIVIELGVSRIDKDETRGSYMLPAVGALHVYHYTETNPISVELARPH